MKISIIVPIYNVLPWHFWREFIEKEKAFLLGGGRFIFPLLEIEMI